MAANTNTQGKSVNLTASVIHCVKTGLPIATMPSGLAKLNARLSSGQCVAGVAIGHVKYSPEVITAFKAKLGSVPNYRWAARSRSGEWKQYDGYRIGEHNAQVLAAFGINADPATLSKGKTEGRQYGTQYEAPKPKAQKAAPVSVAMEDVMALLGDDVVICEESAEDFVLERGHTQCPLPTQSQMQRKSAYPKWLGEAASMGFNRDEAQVAWQAAKRAISGATPVAKPKARSVSEVTIAKRNPRLASTPNTIQCTPDALQATLAALEGATIGGFANGVFTVTYGA